MTEIFFYHLQRRGLEDVLPDLLEKALGRGWRALVLVSSAARAEALSAALWSYGRASFLPHGTTRDGMAECQPIWLTDHFENPNGAKILFLADGMEIDATCFDRFERVCDIFHDNDPDAVAAARVRWKNVKDLGHSLTYWQQSERGAWEKKAEA